MKRVALSWVRSTPSFRRWRSNNTGQNFGISRLLVKLYDISLLVTVAVWHEHLNAANSSHFMQFLRDQLAAPLCQLLFHSLHFIRLLLNLLVVLMMENFKSLSNVVPSVNRLSSIHPHLNLWFKNLSFKTSCFTMSNMYHHLPVKMKLYNVAFSV